AAGGGTRCRPAQPRLLQGTSAGPLQEAAGDDQLLDLVRALADEQEGRVAVVALRPVLERVSVAPVDTHAVDRVLLRRLGGEQLRHPRLEVGALAAGLRARGLEDEQPRRLRP